MATTNAPEFKHVDFCACRTATPVSREFFVQVINIPLEYEEYEMDGSNASDATKAHIFIADADCLATYDTRNIHCTKAVWDTYVVEVVEEKVVAG
eukprot:scaffold297234_cov17-Tisochrysis_lutea.AAC.1